MTGDPWTLLVLGVAMLSVIRPAWATVAQWQARPSMRRRQSLLRAGGGAVMVTLAVYLATEAKPVTGRGYWDLVLLSVDAPFMRTLPRVWVPALCWVLLVVLGCWFLYEGVRGSRGLRDSMSAVWAFNEMAIFGGLLWWGVYLPYAWAEATLVNFGLKGLYVSFLVGSLVRFLLIMLGPGHDPAHPNEHGLGPEGRAWLGRLRRY